jgi:hypothetical protein
MSIRIPSPQLRVMRDQLIDVALDCYIDWREQSRAAMAAYASWASAPSTQRPLAFATYQAALDREEHAARHYASAIEAVERMLEAGR